jgi:hypothetical protein
MPMMSGRVVEINIKGYGRRSVQLLFSIDSGHRKQSFVARDKPRKSDAGRNGHEPQVFSGLAALLSAAYVAKEDVQVEYVTVKGDTPHVVSVGMSAVGVRNKRRSPAKTARRA